MYVCVCVCEAIVCWSHHRWIHFTWFQSSLLRSNRQTCFLSIQECNLSRTKISTSTTCWALTASVRQRPLSFILLFFFFLMTNTCVNFFLFMNSSLTPCFFFLPCFFVGVGVGGSRYEMEKLSSWASFFFQTWHTQDSPSFYPTSIFLFLLLFFCLLPMMILLMSSICKIMAFLIFFFFFYKYTIFFFFFLVLVTALYMIWCWSS